MSQVFSALSSFSVLGVPIDCAVTNGGTTLSPEIFRRAQLPRVLSARDEGDLRVKLTDARRDPISGIVASDEVCRATKVIKDKVYSILVDGRVPVLMGGCCTQLVGAVAGARDFFGEVALVYIDGHLDLYDGKTSPTGEAADMPLAVLLGRGPKEFQHAAGQSPIVNERSVALLGYRDLEDARSRGSVLPEAFAFLLDHDCSTLESLKCKKVGFELCQKLDRENKKFWLHIDFDVLSVEDFPATDYLMEGGLRWSQLCDLVSDLAQSPQLIGVALSCYNPEKDPGLASVEKIVGLLATTLGTRVSATIS